MTPIEYFKEFKYVVVRNFISEDIMPLYYEYCITQVRAMDHKITYYKKEHNEEWDGRFNDTQSPGNFSKYGDFLMESSLNLLTKKAEDYTGIKLNPNYAYWRLYEKGSILERHKDRPSCEISATINLGSNLSNVDKNVYSDYQWPIFVLDKNNLEMPIHLNPGDALIYRGCEVEHWRDEFIGLNNAQVFFHWNEKDGQFNIKYDGRPFLGIPKNK